MNERKELEALVAEFEAANGPISEGELAIAEALWWPDINHKPTIRRLYNFALNVYEWVVTTRARIGWAEHIGRFETWDQALQAVIEPRWQTPYRPCGICGSPFAPDDVAIYPSARQGREPWHQHCWRQHGGGVR